MLNNVYITLKENLMQKFLSDKALLTNEPEVQIVNVNGVRKKIETYLYNGFNIVNVNNIVCLINIPQDSDIFVYRDFIDVTQNSRFDINNILNGTVNLANLVIEGTDGVGKTTVAKALAMRGWLCEDRCVSVITKNMKPEISEDVRLNAVSSYLENNRMKKILFLHLSDENELLRRIYSRGEVTEYDRQAVIFQRLYIETYMKLKDYTNLYLVDCSNKSISQMIEEIEKFILC